MAKQITLRTVLLSILLLSANTAAAAWNEAEQEKLDAACEAARQQELAPERERYIEECVEKKQRPDRAACERFYADYGNRSGQRAPLYYDLPACEKAFEYRRQR